MTTLSTYGGGQYGGFPGLKIGRADENGHKAWADPVQALEDACAHFAARRKLPCPGLAGYVSLDEERVFYLVFAREHYSKRAVLRGYAQTTNDSDIITMTLNIDGFGTVTHERQPGASGGEITIPIDIGDGTASDYQTGASAATTTGVEVIINSINGDSTITPGGYLYSLWLEILPMDQIEV